MFSFKIKYLIRKRQIGDVLWIEPVIRQLATRYKKVYVYTKYNELFENYPLPNVVFKTKLNLLEKVLSRVESFFGTRRWFINLDMAYENSPEKHFLNAYQQKAGLPCTEEYPQLFLGNEDNKGNLKMPKDYVVIHLESLSDKNYRKVFGVNWEEVVLYLKNRGFKIYQIGKSPEKIEGTEVLKTSIREMIGIISNASMFIGIDSGPSHIAASLKVPSLVFFGAVNPITRHFPSLFKGRFLQQSCEFAGCYHSTINTEGPECRLVGPGGIPKCSLHSSTFVVQQIELLIREYHLC
ncbi:glycosyltransferase family 9 protein [Aridibaculum aurantiacum]|uniref:glycosyltransferase family 9 protein n=1 Tax=Aridibaculum aurantiacum TaxID=2810307 RepID=UPI001A9643F7|nr:glycosyltransferase family 9 protein [Aridibaculum aurantiacum]